MTTPERRRPDVGELSTDALAGAVGSSLATESVLSAAGVVGNDSTVGLVQAVLDAEAEREQAQREGAKPVLFADELLPGVGAEETTLREGLKKAGRATFIVLIALTSLDGLQGAGLSVLAPDIQKTFGVSSGAIVFISAASGAFLILGAVPMGWLADRFRRGPIIGISGLLFAAMVALSGLAINIFTFFWARFGVGIAQSSTIPVNGSLLADTYPIGLRGRIGAATGFANGIVTAISPIAVGGIAAAVGGTAGWRWAMIVLGLPVVVVALLAFRLPEPPRGQHEMTDVLGGIVQDSNPVPMSLEASFARLMRIRTVRTTIMAFSAIGFGLFTGPVLGNLFLDEHYHLGSFKRGLVGTIGGLGVVAVLPFAGKYYDRLYRKDPPRALALIGIAVLPSAFLAPIQYFMPSWIGWMLLSIPQTILLMTAYSLVGPVLQTIVPYRLRGMGTALGAIYIFFIGATGGALLAALLTNSFGPRTAVLVLFIPSTIIGGLLILRSASFVRNDLSLIVAELQEELDESERQRQDPEHIPVIQVNHIDFSYGQVQVLFDVGFEVRRGEVLALLGTNGAGKSTVLRVIAGLGVPSRGVVRLNGRSVTLASPERRARLGIHMLPGGKGVFGSMTVLENLELGAFIYRDDPADFERRVARAFELFPVLAGRREDIAGSLSGGQQQMLALARVLLHDPEVLIIDELSLGLAPAVVQDLIAVVERLRASGMTIIVVEQSLNVAAAISDRAVFMEKGQVRFDGPTRQLMERDDLARAVFLGGKAD
jgi:ABC-type branched-subunit amino acid transport system ATPase component/predicted MFS family arabinose efflux permease